MYCGIIAVCSEIYSLIKGFPLYTVFPHVPASQHSLLSPVVSHTPSSPYLSLGLPFVLVPSGSHCRILHDSLFSGILFKYPNRRSSFPTITLIYAFLLLYLLWWFHFETSLSFIFLWMFTEVYTKHINALYDIHIYAVTSGLLIFKQFVCRDKLLVIIPTAKIETRPLAPQRNRKLENNA